MNDGKPTPFFNMTQAEVFDEYVHVVDMRASTMMDAKDPSAIVAVEVRFSDGSTTIISQSTPGDACDFASGLIQSAHESRFYSALYMVMRDSMRRSDGDQITTESVMVPFNHMVSAIRDHLPHVDHALRQPSTDTPDGPITSNAADVLLACARCREPVSVRLLELPDAVRTAYQDDPRLVNVLCAGCTTEARLPWTAAGKATVGVRTTVDTPDLGVLFETQDDQADDQGDQVTP